MLLSGWSKSGISAVAQAVKRNARFDMRICRVAGVKGARVVQQLQAGCQSAVVMAVELLKCGRSASLSRLLFCLLLCFAALVAVQELGHGVGHPRYVSSAPK